MSRSIDIDRPKPSESAEDDLLKAGNTPEAAENSAIDADDGIKALKQQLADERSRREASDRRAQEAETQVFHAKTEVEGNNLTMITNAIETVKSGLSNLRNAYAEAMTQGQYARAADLQLEMASGVSKLQVLESGKQNLEERPMRAPPPPVEADPVEALAARLTPRSAAWVRKHPECATDPRMFRKMLRAHEDAIDDGMTADSDDYFSAVESRLGLNKRQARDDEDDDGTELAAQPVSRRQSPAAAPVSRSGSNGSSSTTRVRLTAAERDAARASHLTDEEYFREQQRIKRGDRVH